MKAGKSITCAGGNQHISFVPKPKHQTKTPNNTMNDIVKLANLLHAISMKNQLGKPARKSVNKVTQYQKERQALKGVKPVLIEMPYGLVDIFDMLKVKRNTTRTRLIVDALWRGAYDMLDEQELVDNGKKLPIKFVKAKPPLPKNMAMARDQHRMRLKGLLPPHNLTARKGMKK
jgi:hypothetical protein